MKTLPDGYKRRTSSTVPFGYEEDGLIEGCLLYTSDAADE